MSEKFWAVCKETGGPPSKRHETLDDAKAEAARLARQANEPYHVLKVIGVVKPVETPIEYEEIT